MCAKSNKMHNRHLSPEKNILLLRQHQHQLVVDREQHVFNWSQQRVDHNSHNSNSLNSVARAAVQCPFQRQLNQQLPVRQPQLSACSNMSTTTCRQWSALYTLIVIVTLFSLQLGLCNASKQGIPKTVCGTQFTDVPSKVYLADIVFQGTVVRFVPSKVRDPNVTVSTNDTVFKIVTVAKGNALLKNAHREYVHVGIFRNEPRPGQCVGSVAINATYFVYVRLVKHGRAHSYRITAFPDLDTKATRQLVKTSACDTCARAPRVSIVQPKMNVTVVQAGRRVKIECEADVGHPHPLLHWHHDDKILHRTDRINIRQTRKGSRVTIKNVSPEDAGRYACVAKNVIGTSLDQVDISVRRTPSTSPPAQATSPPNTNTNATGSVECFGHYCLCPEQAYCLNGGTCFQMQSIKTLFCRCVNDYIGNRCQEQISAGFDLARLAKTGAADVRWTIDELKLPPEILKWLDEKRRVAVQN